MLIRFIAFIFLTLTVLSSCKKDFLEIDPVGKIIATTVTDYTNLFYNSALLSTSFSDLQIPLSDEVAAVNTYLAPAQTSIQRLFRWEKDIYTEEENAVEFTTLMAQVYLMNKIANEVMGATGGTDVSKKALQAEARATRAWSYFMLINYYGKPYNAATAATDPGFPIVTEADAAATTFTRASVQEVYDFILKDLTETMPLLPQNTTVRTRMNKSAAMALLGKVYVFMGRYADALVQLKAASANFPTNFSNDLFDYNTTLAVGGAWGYSPTVNSYTGAPLPYLSNESILARHFFSNYMTTTNYLLLTKEGYDLYSVNDQRKKLFTYKVYPTTTGLNFPANTGGRRFGAGTVVPYGITYPDYFLLQAECKARTNDLAGAKDDLKAFRIKRMPKEDTAVNASTQNDLIKFVIDERRREFALMGFRWFDMRRLSNDPLFSANVITHKIYDINGNLQETITMPKERLVMRLPSKIIAQNPGIENNP